MNDVVSVIMLMKEGIRAVWPAVEVVVEDAASVDVVASGVDVAESVDVGDSIAEIAPVGRVSIFVKVLVANVVGVVRSALDIIAEIAASVDVASDVAAPVAVAASVHVGVSIAEIAPVGRVSIFVKVLVANVVWVTRSTLDMRTEVAASVDVAASVELAASVDVKVSVTVTITSVGRMSIFVKVAVADGAEAVRSTLEVAVEIAASVEVVASSDVAASVDVPASVDVGMPRVAVSLTVAMLMNDRVGNASLVTSEGLSVAREGSNVVRVAIGVGISVELGDAELATGSAPGSAVVTNWKEVTCAGISVNTRSNYKDRSRLPKMVSSGDAAIQSCTLQ